MTEALWFAVIGVAVGTLAMRMLPLLWMLWEQRRRLRPQPWPRPRGGRGRGLSRAMAAPSPQKKIGVLFPRPKKIGAPTPEKKQI